MATTFSKIYGETFRVLSQLFHDITYNTIIHTLPVDSKLY